MRFGLLVDEGEMQFVGGHHVHGAFCGHFTTQRSRRPGGEHRGATEGGDVHDATVRRAARARPRRRSA